MKTKREALQVLLRTIPVEQFYNITIDSGNRISLQGTYTPFLMQYIRNNGFKYNKCNAGEPRLKMFILQESNHSVFSRIVITLCTTP